MSCIARGIFAIAFTLFVTAQSASDETSEKASCVQTNPVGASCGIKGRIQPGYTDLYVVYEPQIVNNVKECALLCSRRTYNHKYRQAQNSYNYNSWCSSFQYDTASQFCQLGRLNISDDVVESVPSSRDIFYDLACFDCGELFCNQPLGANLLDNGDFGQQLLGPWYARGGTLRRELNGAGHYFACSAKPGHPYGYGPACMVAQDYNTCAGDTYAVTFDYGLEAKGKEGSLMRVQALHDYAPDGPIARYFATVKNKKRTGNAKLYYQANKTPGFGFEVQFDDVVNYDGGLNSTVDNARAYRTTVLPITGAKNILTKSGFESGDLGAWILPKTIPKSYYSVISPGIRSTYGLRVKGDLSIRQALKLKSNTTHLLSFDVAVSHDGTGFDVHLGRYSYEFSKQKGNFSISMPLPPVSSSPTLQIYMTLPLSRGSAFVVDNFSLLEAEEKLS